VQQWRNLPEYTSQLRMMSSVTLTTEKLQDIATQAARWGADQELEACCEWLIQGWDNVKADKLRAARRPKPPSLKEQALAELVDAYDEDRIDDSTYDTIRRAIEALPE
jgi:hypothetical protein